MERPTTVKALSAVGGDVASVLLFVALGRSAHHDELTAGGMASTSWPFLAGLAGGWLAARGWRRPMSLLPTGVSATVGCVGLGMVLRVTAGQGTEPAFIAVAAAFLAFFLLGWRTAAIGIDRLQAPRATA